MIKIILVRHGLTKWNKEDRLQGNINTSLSSEGKKQAEKLAKRLRNEKIDIIFTSPMNRAYETAKIINKRHNYKLLIDENLKEIKYGIFEGFTKKELEQNKKLKGMWNKRKRDVMNFKIPKGESFSDLLKRAKKVLNKILKYDNKTILVVCHGQTKRALIQLLTDMSDEEAQKQYFHPTSVSVIEIGKKEIKKILINCTKHLE